MKEKGEIMSRVQTGKTETVENSHPVTVKVNDVLIDEADTGKLELAKQRISQVYNEIESELIHRSQDDNISIIKEDTSLLKSSNEDFIKIILKSNNIPPVTVDSLVSPTFVKLLKNNLWITQALIKLLMNSPDTERIKVLSVIIPAFIFSVLTLLLVYYSERVNGLVVLGSIVAGIVSLIISLKLLRFFSQARRYIVQEKIRKDNLPHRR